MQPPTSMGNGRPVANAPPLSILMYHQVGEFRSPKTHRAGFCHSRQFRAQMAYLKRFGYRVISLRQALDGLFYGAELPERAVVLTFDDGYENFHQNAFPVLQKYNFPAISYFGQRLYRQVGTVA
ncbi:MAG: polysaccharide deacetylase family protein [Candidatus Competibacteraceae bacterium]